METQEIRIRYVNLPKAGKTYGSIKDYDDEYYWSTEDFLRNVEPGDQGTLYFHWEQWGKRDVRVIDKFVPGAVGADADVPFDDPPDIGPDDGGPNDDRVITPRAKPERRSGGGSAGGRSKYQQDRGKGPTVGMIFKEIMEDIRAGREYNIELYGDAYRDAVTIYQSLEKEGLV